MSGREKELSIIIRTQHEAAQRGLEAVNSGLGTLGQQARAAQQALTGITEFRRLKGDTEAAEKAWKGATVEVGRLAAELKATENPTKAQVREFDNAKKSAGRLKDEYEKNRDKLHALRKSLSDAGVSTTSLAGDQRKLEGSLKQVRAEAEANARLDTARGVLDVKAPRDVKAEIDKLRNAYRELQQGHREGTVSAKELHQAKVQLGKKTAELTQSTHSWTDSIAKATVGLAGLAGIGYGLMKSFAKYSEFATKMAEVSTLTDASAERMKILGNEITDLSTRIPQTAAQFAAAQYDILSSGVALEKSTKVLELAAKAAVAGVTDTKTAVNVGVGVINAYGLEIDELGNVYDVLFQTVKNGVTTFPELAASLGQTLPTAKAAGVSYQEVSAALAELTKAGIKTPIAATALRGAINAMAAPTAAAKKQFDELGITWNGLIPTLEQIATKNLSIDQMRLLIPDVEARTGVMSLTGNLVGLRETLGGVNAASGETEEAYQKIANTPEKQLELLKNAIDKLSISLGGFVAEFAVPAAAELTRIINIIGSDEGLIQSLKLLGESFGDVSEGGEGFLTLVAGIAEGVKILALGLQTAMVPLRLLGEVAAATFASIMFAIEGDFKSAMRVLQDTTPGDKLRADLDRLEKAAENIGSTFKAVETSAKDSAVGVAEVKQTLAEATPVVNAAASSVKSLEQRLNEATAALEGLTEADEGYQAALEAKIKIQREYDEAAEELQRKELARQQRALREEELELRDSLDRRLFEIQKMRDLDALSQRQANIVKLRAEQEYLAQVVELRRREMEAASKAYEEDKETYIAARRAMAKAETDLERAAWAVNKALREVETSGRQAGQAGAEAGERGAGGMRQWHSAAAEARGEMERLTTDTQKAGQALAKFFYGTLDAVKKGINEIQTLEELHAFARENKLGTAMSNPTATGFDAAMRRSADQMYRQRMVELEEKARQAAQDARAALDAAREPASQGQGRTLTLQFATPDGKKVSGQFADADAGRLIEMLRQAGMVVT